MAIKFTDHTVEIINELEKKSIAFLEEAKSSLSAQAAKNSPVKSGALKRSFVSDSRVDKSEYTAYIGSSLEYAIFQEYGTGEHALEGNGRKGGWVYRDHDTGKTVFTRGNRPRRMLYNAFQQKKAKIKTRGQEIFRG